MPTTPDNGTATSRRPHRSLADIAGDLVAIDLRSLAVFRVALGLAVLVDTIVRAFDLVELYTDAGVWPRELLRAEDGPAVALSAHYWASVDPRLEAALFVLTAVSGLVLAVGWRTRIATFACWYLVSSVQIRQPLTYMGGDSILRLLLFWSMFLPLGARFSLDRSQGRTQSRPDRVVSVATAALLLQVCFVYWFTGLGKDGPLWKSGQAVYYILHLDPYATARGVRLGEYVDLLVPLTFASLALERFGPFLAFVPYYTAACRMLTIALFWGFHLGLAITLNIGLFPLFSMVSWLPFSTRCVVGTIRWSNQARSSATWRLEVPHGGRDGARVSPVCGHPALGTKRHHPSGASYTPSRGRNSAALAADLEHVRTGSPNVRGTLRIRDVGRWGSSQGTDHELPVHALRR